MEQELKFGLDLGRLAVLKKRVWSDREELLRVFFFSCFHWQKKSYLKKNAHENMKNLALKVAHNHIFSVMPTGPNLAQISIPVP